jgi:zinc ribbon protein
MMMGVGLLFMVVVGLVVIGVPVLIVAMIAGGGMAKLFKSQPRPAEPDHSPSPVKTNVDRKCPTCGRAVKPDWNLCPSCGAALT